jgi:tetratricopeptide (TPR) repeat protein
MADPQKELDAGLQLAKQGYHDRALKHFRKLIENGDPGWAERGRIESGLVLKKRGDLAGAARAYQQAIDSGHPDWAPCAAFNLGVLLTDTGNRSAAIDAYLWAAKSRHPEWGARAGLNLGVTLRDADNPSGAAAAYQLAIDSGHRVFAPQACYNLGILLAGQGDVSGARRAYQTAIDSGSAEWAPAAALNLGVLLMKQADLEGAAAAYQIAITSGHKRWAQQAATNLAVMRKHESDPESIEVGSKEVRWTGKLRDGETEVFDTTILTPAKEDRGTNLKAEFMRSVGADKTLGIRRAITITNRRIRIDQLSFDFDDVASWSSRSWDPSVDTVAYKIKKPKRHSFTIVGKNGSSAEIEFSEGVPDNLQVFNRLVGTARREIQPLLDGERHRRHDTAMQQLRSGQKVEIKTPAGAVVFSMTRNGFLDPGHSGEAETPWSAFAAATMRRGKLTVQIRDAKGKTRDYASFGSNSSVADLLTRCANEFA